MCRYLNHVLTAEDPAGDVGACRHREARSRVTSSASEPQLGRRKPRVPLPPAQERRRARWLDRCGDAREEHDVGWCSPPRSRGCGSWCETSAPWPSVVALALPVIVVAALIGLIISAFDDRKLSSLLVAVSVLAFGWVTIVEPRSAMPASPPVDPIRIASITLDGSTLNASAIVGSLAKQRADVAIVVEPSKKARSVLLRADRYPYTLTSGRFVVLSTIPVDQLPLPKGLPDDLIVRLQVDRPAGSFIVYAVRTGTSPLDAAQNDPIGIERLRDAARDERLPVVLAGDFGISDRSSGYRTLDGCVPRRDAIGCASREHGGHVPVDLPVSADGVRADVAGLVRRRDGATFDVQDAPSVGLVSGGRRLRTRDQADSVAMIAPATSSVVAGGRSSPGSRRSSVRCVSFGEHRRHRRIPVGRRHRPHRCDGASWPPTA